MKLFLKNNIKEKVINGSEDGNLCNANRDTGHGTQIQHDTDMVTRQT